MSEHQSENDQSLATLYVLPYLRWEREWYDSFETGRARLLDALSDLLNRIDLNPPGSETQELPPEGVNLNNILLGGQTVLLEDLAAIRPDLLAMLVIHNARNRVEIGPWYTQVDTTLVSGEALVRNLLAARATARQHGINLLPVGFLPGEGGHTAQIPQILRGFGIDAAFVQRGVPVPLLPFRWEAPDGSAVLAINHWNPYYVSRETPGIEADAVNMSISRQDAITPDGPYLWVHSYEQQPIYDYLKALAAVQADAYAFPQQNSLTNFASAMRRSLPDNLRPPIYGELRQQNMREGNYIHPGTLSARVDLKQINAELQTLLTYAAEPWLAVALTAQGAARGTARGAAQSARRGIAFPQNLRELLDYAWRVLLKNQSRHTLAGTSSDAVYSESLTRAGAVRDTGRYVVRQALSALSGEPYVAHPDHPPALIADEIGRQKTYVSVWNPHNWAVEQVVEIKLYLPPQVHPAVLSDPEGKEESFGWIETPDPLLPEFHIGVLSFVAHVPPVGYACYELALSRKQPGDYHSVMPRKGRGIISVPTPTSLEVEDGAIVWRRLEPPVVGADGTIVQPEREAWRIGDLLRFVDGGDAGDTYNYSPPEPDVVISADLINDVHVEQSPLYQRLTFRHRLRLAPELQADRSRKRGLKTLELLTTATFYDYMPGIYFRTTFVNTAKDHRLRVHLRTGIMAENVLADAPFALISRKAQEKGPVTPPNMRANLEGIINTYPMQTLAAVMGSGAGSSAAEIKGMALLGRGLHEFEALYEDNQVTLALTLLRAVGWLSRGDLRTRTGQVAPMLAVPNAQLYEHELTADYALMPLMEDDPAALLRAGRGFSIPLQAYQHNAPPQFRKQSYLRTEGDVILSALKPPQRGDGWIVRFFNPGTQLVEARLHPYFKPQSAHRVTLAEDRPETLKIDEDGGVSVRVEPQQIVTLRLGFGE